MTPTFLIQKGLERYVGSEKKEDQNQCHPLGLPPTEKFSCSMRKGQDGLLVGVYLQLQGGHQTQDGLWHQEARDCGNGGSDRDIPCIKGTIQPTV
eukprot:Skav211808  [mRNA]  locus=scaffold305:469476:470111:+ [translate_table: standard]